MKQQTWGERAAAWAITVGAVTGCAADAPGPAKPQAGQANPPAAAVAPAVVAGGVRSIELPAIETVLPPGPGQQTVATTCTICHSQRNILQQPRFSRAAWAAEVEKMKKNYGAPVGDEQAKEVVEYLVSIRGAAEPATKP